ncbi:InlB B-repeat-containing protein [Bifidobacterium adolescentis]|uniref:InlB B-repeat-containing protein n=1 Tax=Bifidobacterium adolescentis TaxID=1680 RepID=UPI00189F403B|nr:InlB B-repeat-containing protein [Bifidobacterium adolescentis]MDB0585326.1 InlB B-repeat-containing protein [Bifidobacterium adolescentis]MDB0587204.1 InlB B-repeat-containing protein [Bifidobacterium adolescentis]MDB0617405.1 InlB B-repeat-containing protein [Bifidobacterium adolescentis]MDB0621050.1 InlB B-repeat-containing protein [Bifidobacterium adolescentis]MDB0622267.1 InlB B-repeat-containing protein [Bifidobacterium adolescentis]
MGFLTRLLAGLTAAAALGAGLTGTANAVDVTGATGNTKSVVKLAADDTNNLPDHIVNGNFEYPVKSDMPVNDGNFWYISQNDGSYFANGTVLGKRYKLPEGFDKAKFAWHSTQTGDTYYPDLERADDVQVDYTADGTNHYSEISAAQSGATIYQDVATVPGVMYKWSLKHASLDSSHLDKMSVIIGEPGKETAQEATRTTANGHGDKLGKVGTVISTKVSNPEMPAGNKFQEGAHTGQWETYTGTYIATGTVTRFAFRSVEGYSAWDGNLLDDISFSKAYKLTYDKNASDATGSVPSDTTANTVKQAKADATGTVKTVTDTKTKTSGTVKTVADTNASLPDHLVNGDFNVNYHDQWKDSFGGWTSIDPNAGKTLHATSLPNGSSWKWTAINGWDKSKFGWTSTQKAGSNVQQKANAVELQYDDSTADNVYAELCAYEAGTAIYQDIRTVPGTLYKVRLKHASLNSTYLDKMQVMIGTPGHEQPVEMTRTTVNGHGDKLNEKSTTIATKVTNSNNRHHADQWETYEGTYLIPDGQTTTRFTFKSIDAKQLDYGNVLDDIVFDKAYRLSYDKNASDATGKVPSNQRGKENTVQPAKSKTTGTVRAVADRTASGLTVHDLETDDVPGDYRQFVLNTTDTRLSQVEFENGAWYRSTDSSSQGMWPLKLGASLTIPSVGEWTDPSGKTHQISMTMRLKDWNGGSVSELYRFDGHGNIVGDGRFWINTAYGSGYSSLPAKVKAAMGGVDTSKRVGCSWTVEFTYADTGEKVPDTFKGVTGFNDLDGWDAQSDLKFEGVQLLDGFDGAYKRSDAELGTYGTNGFAGIGHDAGDEAHLNAPQQSRHRLAATWTGSTFTFSYDLSNPAGRTDGSRMTFGAPVTRTAVLTYDRNAADASGQVPSNTTPDTTQTASSKSTGKVSDLVQRTTTHEDGSVTVRTIDTSTDVVSGCQVYYPAGQRITLATMAKDDDCWDSSMLSRPGHTQLGWNQDRNATQAQAQVTMVEGGMTVYAVWVGNPVLTYDTNKPSTWSGQMPSTPASVSVPYNAPAADGSGWRAGDVSKIRGYRFLGWYTTPQDNAGLYDWTRPLTGSVTVYAHWQRLQANVVYNANGGTGSHPNTTGWQYSDVTIPGDTSKSFKRDKYVFKGWGTKPGKADVVYKDGSKVALQDKDITLYAQWQEVHENFVETGGIGLPIAIAGGVLLLMFGIGSTVMLTRRMNGHGMPDDE